jgi:hypothetical protein
VVFWYSAPDRHDPPLIIRPFLRPRKRTLTDASFLCAPFVLAPTTADHDVRLARHSVNQPRTARQRHITGCQLAWDCLSFLSTLNLNSTFSPPSHHPQTISQTLPAMRRLIARLREKLRKRKARTAEPLAGPGRALPPEVVANILRFVCPHALDDSCDSLGDSPPTEVCPPCSARDLAHCALVNKAWNGVATPLL